MSVHRKPCVFLKTVSLNCSDTLIDPLHDALALLTLLHPVCCRLVSFVVPFLRGCHGR